MLTELRNENMSEVSVLFLHLLKLHECKMSRRGNFCTSVAQISKRNTKKFYIQTAN